ncbi:FAD-dependent monooxygenase [Sulfurivirga sp.]|uniref:FAD-dependent monooxygenase n=1 Tax=Sulfurivirga sp. TaxID=2614236 RepID=UPI0025F18F8A|nr:FAD-dependent monooxygenase [Sulfurivirga sp.]
MAERYDLIISGGGPVGLTLALGAARQGRSVLVLEQAPPEQGGESFDGRMLALNRASRAVLQRVGAWEALAPQLTAIEHVHVSQRGHFGVVTLHAGEQGVDALGWSVLGRDLGLTLQRLVQETPNITLRQPARLTDFRQTAEGVEVRFQGGEAEAQAHGRLLVGADGTRSRVREVLGWPLEEKDYGAWAVIAQVETHHPHDGWAFERFTPDGPVALLPWRTRQHKAVMVVPDREIDRIMGLDDSGWLAAFEAKMGPRFGGFAATSPRLRYPLKESYVQRVAEGRVALLGNASHTQHPVAAQGLNLGLRDVADYLDGLALEDALEDPAWLSDYEQRRRQDHRAVMGATDSLIALFQLPQPLAGHLRGAGLLGLQLAAPLKRRLAGFFMGERT